MKVPKKRATKKRTERERKHMLSASAQPNAYSKRTAAAAALPNGLGATTTVYAIQQHIIVPLAVVPELKVIAVPKQKTKLHQLATVPAHIFRFFK